MLAAVSPPMAPAATTGSAGIVGLSGRRGKVAPTHDTRLFAVAAAAPTIVPNPSRRQRMALSLVEASKLSNDTLLAGVIETMAQESPILQRLPFIDWSCNKSRLPALRSGALHLTAR